MEKSTSKLVSLSFLLLAYTNICNGGQYTVIGGNKIRPFSDYTLAVSWTGEQPNNLVLEISNPKHGFREAQELTLEPESTKIASFKIGNLQPGNYNLTIRSTSVEEFYDYVPLQYENKTYCIFLHTDKTVYQPGDIIYFRLLVLNAFLKPLLNIKPDLTLKDGRGNVVKKWPNAPLSKGVFSNEIQVAEFPVYGDWIFEININDQSYSQKVLVADFVLPKFLMKIDGPKHIYFNDEKFSVSVKAQQLTGQNVVGELTLSAYPVFFSGVIQPIFQAPVRKVVPIDGHVDIEINIKNDLKLTEIEGSERSVVVEAVVEEALTGRRHNVSTLIHLHRTRQALFYNVPSYYKSNMPFVVQLKTSAWENENVFKAKPVQIKYSFSGEGEERAGNVLEADCWFDLKGECQHIYYPQSVSNQSLLDIEIRYMDIKEKISGIKSFQSPSKNFLQAQLLEHNPKVNEKVKVGINCTEPINVFSYYVIGRGNIVYANTVQVVPARKVNEFEFHATQAMAPEATIIITYLRNTKELIGDSFKFKVDGILLNNVEVKILPQDPEPLGNLDVMITAPPNSYIALMAGSPSPDFSISTNHHYKAGEGSGLSPEKVLEELQSFSGYNNELMYAYETVNGQMTMEIFKESRVFLMTNNKVNGKYSTYYESENGRAERSTRPPLAGPYAFSHLPPLPVPRLHLGRLPTPTWLFTNTTSNGDSETILGRRVSANAGNEWSVGAWVVHPTLGLGFASTVKANVRRRLLTVSAPSNIKEGETIAVIVNLLNPYYYPLTAEITLQNPNQEFRFEDLSNEINSNPKVELYQRQKLSVPANRTSSVVFFIVPVLKPSVTGTTITLDINSSAKGARESLQHQLTIFPEGEEMIDQSSILLDVDNSPINSKITLKNKTLSDNRRPSKISYEELQTGVTGSLLGPALGVIPRLLDIPPANGYFNMLPFMASVLLLQHLENDIPDSVRLEGINAMKKLYQQQMLYRKRDGSFGINIDQKSEGSIWVTGITAQWFSRAIKISEVGVERTIINNALQWLSKKQYADGSFRESTTLPIDDPLQQNPVTLTALTLQAFLDTRLMVGEEYRNLISKAQDWLVKNIAKAADEKWDAGVLAPLSGILHAAGHPAAIQATHLLNSLANVTDGKRWWELTTVEGEMKNPWRKGSSRNVWVTAWGLQALLAQGYLSEALETAEILVSYLTDWSDLMQSLPALPALINLSKKLPKETQVTLEFYCPNDKTTFTVNNENRLIFQKKQVRGSECKIMGNGKGTTISLLQGIRRTNVTGAWPRFTLDPRVDAISTPHRLQLSICIGFVPLPGEEMSGPVLMKLRLPSGFVADLDITALLSSGVVRAAHEVHLKKISSEPPLQMILSPLKTAERCITLKASRIYPIANERPGVITLVDLTDNSRRARAFFSGGQTSACALCGGVGAKGCGGSGQGGSAGGCIAAARQQSSLPDEVKTKPTSHANTAIGSVLTILILNVMIHKLNSLYK